ncbi:MULTISPECIES: type II toxin-antitoxin system VapC family toxin [unclassified Moraxella]|uniref:type II toxin-antitoxin system VapC family toxin n=1 Tax=unclassified Moraxella TaxID=2685852 RepID=UPI003AF8423E
MKYMLDTNIISYLMKNNPLSVAIKVAQLTDNDKMIMSFVTYAELLKGAKASQHESVILQKLALILQRVGVVYPSDSKVCEHYAEQFLQLKAKGTPIGNNDLWIACHALAEQAVLVTHNVKEFERIVGLTVEDWVT